MTAHEVGITDIPIISVLFTEADISAIHAEAPGAAEGVISFQIWVASSTHQSSQSFVAAYKDRYSTMPDEFAAGAYAATQIMFDALSRVLPETDVDSIKGALQATRELDTIYGDFAFDENGDAIYDPTIVIVQNGQFAPLFE